MAKKLFIILFAIFAITLTIKPNSAKLDATTSKQTDFYYSTSNAPVFYGATGITMSKNAVENFDVNDPRFRLFARDFEDGDLLVTCVKQNVDVSTPGEYTISYSATDTHNNKVSIDVPVKILNDENGEIDVVRRAHTIPNDWNMANVGFYRNNNGDREILGIYVPAGKTFQFRVLTENWKATLSLFNDHRNHETYAKQVAYNENKDFETITLEANDKQNYDYVPFIVSTKLERGVNINTTFDYEIKYNVKDVRKLDYYYYNESEDVIFNTFKTNENNYAVIESESIIILLTKKDIDSIKKYEFNSIKEHLDYYEAVIKRMDEIVGLSFQPQKATDQNFRAKQFVKGDGGTSAGAYYTGGFGFVGISGAQVGTFYQMNWGGLHEIAHGYQGGFLGGGNLGLGEVSNNILAHYIQMSELCAKASPSVIKLGDLSKCEDERNKARLEENKTFVSCGDVTTRLYALINLLDSFEGPDTYAKLFSYVREKVNDGTYKSGIPQQDLYSLFFADVYNTDITSYWDAWGEGVTEEVKEQVMQRSKEHLSILSDTTADKLGEILEGENLERKFGLVNDQVFKKYGLKSNLDVTINLNQMLDGKFVLLTKNDEIIYQQQIINGKANFSNIDTGVYVIRLPILKNYHAPFSTISLKEGENQVSLNYVETYINNNYHPTQLVISGVRGTNGYVIDFSKSDNKATISLGASDMGNQTNEWKGKPTETFISVKWKNPGDSGTIIDERNICGGQYFSIKGEKIECDYEYGSTIEIFTKMPQNVKVISLISNVQIEEYKSVSNNFTFEITSKGLILKSAENLNFEDTFYNYQKDTLQQNLAHGKEFFNENPELLDAKYYSQTEKHKFVESYDRLKEEDRSQYSDLYNQILEGGKPEIYLVKEKVLVKQWADVNFYSLVTAIDKEDGNIILNENNFKIIYNGNTTELGEHDVTIEVCDSDGNASSAVLTIEIVPEQAPVNTTAIAVGSAAASTTGLGLTGAVLYIVKKKKRH